MSTTWRSRPRLPSKTWAFRRPLHRLPSYPAPLLPTPTIPSTRPRDLCVRPAIVPTPTNAAASTRLAASWCTTRTPRTYPRCRLGRAVRGTPATPADTTTPSTAAAVPSLGCHRFHPLIWPRLYHPPTTRRRHQTTATPKICKG